jgi:hypothetical protein
MKKLISALMVVSFVFMGIIAFSTTAQADEVKMVGVISKIEIASKDAKAANVTLIDNKTEQPVTVEVTDELTLDKFKDNRIVVGDEIRCKYETKDGKNVSVLFKKTAGC